MTLTRVRRRAGDGSVDDPHRTVTDYWTADGQLVASLDPESPTPERESLLADALAEAVNAMLVVVEHHPLTPDALAKLAERAALLRKVLA